MGLLRHPAGELSPESLNQLNELPLLATTHNHRVDARGSSHPAVSPPEAAR
jgi:hypothetical protein